MLTIFADQCVNRDLVESLRGIAKTTVVHANEISLAEAPDEEIFEHSRKSGCVLLTFDKDFGDLRRFDPKTSYGVIIVYVEDFGRESLIREVNEFFEGRSPKSLRGKGFIIQPGRVRPFGSDES